MECLKCESELEYDPIRKVHYCLGCGAEFPDRIDSDEDDW
jgi:hypothetical protein